MTHISSWNSTRWAGYPTPTFYLRSCHYQALLLPKSSVIYWSTWEHTTFLSRSWSHNYTTSLCCDWTTAIQRRNGPSCRPCALASLTMNGQYYLIRLNFVTPSLTSTPTFNSKDTLLVYSNSSPGSPYSPSLRTSHMSFCDDLIPFTWMHKLIDSCSVGEVTNTPLPRGTNFSWCSKVSNFWSRSNQRS